MNPTTVIQRLDQRDMLELVDTVCRKYRVTREEVCGERRWAHVSRARQEIWLRLHEEFGWSSTTIGALWERDHSTVLTGVKKARAARGEEAA